MYHTHIRVTHPGRDHLDQYLTELGFADLDVADVEWIVDVGEYRGTCAHDGFSSMCDQSIFVWPNARRELRLEAGARHERTLEAVCSTPLFGIVRWHGPWDSPAVLLPARVERCAPNPRFQDTSRQQDRKHVTGQATSVPPLPPRQVVLGEGHPIF